MDIPKEKIITLYSKIKVAIMVTSVVSCLLMIVWAYLGLSKEIGLYMFLVSTFSVLTGVFMDAFQENFIEIIQEIDDD